MYTSFKKLFIYLLFIIIFNFSVSHNAVWCSYVSLCCFYLYLTKSCCQADNAISYHDLPMIDQHALFQLENFVNNSRECYENYQFFKIFQVGVFLVLLIFFSYVSV